MAMLPMRDISAQALDTIQGNKQGLLFRRRTFRVLGQLPLPLLHRGFGRVKLFLDVFPISFEHCFSVRFVPVVWSSHG